MTLFIQKLVNLSSKIINKQAKDILIKQRLKFTPVPRTNLIELRADIRKFCRKLRLVEFSADKDFFIYLSNYPLKEPAKESKNAKFHLNKDKWNAIMEFKKMKT